MWLENTYNAVFFLSTDIFFEYYAENNRITGWLGDQDEQRSFILSDYRIL